MPGVLPEICAVLHNITKKPALLKRGESGYYPVEVANFDVVGFNQRHGVTAQQVEAMIMGSMFRWDCPGADPDRCDGRTAREFVEG
jgi:hypothetical protein